MSLTIDNGEFFLATIRDEQTLHADRDDAIAQLRSANGIDPDVDDVSIVKATVTSGDWEIAELAYKTLLIELLRGGDA